MKFSGSSVRQQRPGAVAYGELARLALALALPLAGAIATMYYFGVNGSDANPAWQNKDGFSVPNDPSAPPVSAIVDLPLKREGGAAHFGLDLGEQLGHLGLSMEELTLPAGSALLLGPNGERQLVGPAFLLADADGDLKVWS